MQQETHPSLADLHFYKTYRKLKIYIDRFGRYVLVSEAPHMCILHYYPTLLSVEYEIDTLLDKAEQEFGTTVATILDLFS